MSEQPTTALAPPSGGTETKADDTSGRPIDEGENYRARVAGTSWFTLKRGTDGAPPSLSDQRFDANLSGILGAKNLVVLCGLGTSLGLMQFSRDGSPSSPSGAPSMWDLYRAVSGLAGFEHAETLITPEARERGDVEDLLSKCQFKLALGPPTGGLGGDDGDSKSPLATFVASAEQTILRMCSFVDADTDLGSHEVFLRKLARRQSRLSRAQIFTTNYDLAFERAAEKIRFTVVDGFGFGDGHPFDGSAFDMDIVRRSGDSITLEPNVFHLLKLHGSVDWSEDGREVRKLPRGATTVSPVLIYPAQDKFQLSYRPPYLESMSRLQMALRENDVALIVVGFGFNDAHIAAPIEAAIRSNIGLQILVVDPTAEQLKSETVRMLDRLVEASDRRVSLLATTFDKFVGLMPDVHAPDERELHRQRTERAGEEQ